MSPSPAAFQPRRGSALPSASLCGFAAPCVWSREVVVQGGSSVIHLQARPAPASVVVGLAQSVQALYLLCAALLCVLWVMCSSHASSASSSLSLMVGMCRAARRRSFRVSCT